MSQIKNSSHGPNQDYKPTLQTYAEAGVPGSATINAVMAFTNDSQASNKGGTNSGAIWIDQNPAQSSPASFDFADGLYSAGNFPSGWVSHAGFVIANPAVNVNSSPTVAIRKSSGSDVHVDFLGLYVDYR
jgi:hypothetical protein